MATSNLHKLHFTVKGHHLHPMGRSILDLGHLLAGIGINDPAGVHSKRLDDLDLSLKGDGRIISSYLSRSPLYPFLLKPKITTWLYIQEKKI